MRTVATLAAAAVVFGVLATDSGSNVERVSRPIVFTSNWTPHFRTAEIYVVGAHGGRVGDLTRNELEDRDPAWSPDGRRIAFAQERRHNLDLYVMNADGSGVRRLTRDRAPEREPAWSPDGKRLAFVAPGARNEKGYPVEQISVMNADGTGARRLTNEEGGAGEPAWSPDGTKIAGVLGGGFAIFTMNADGSGLRTLGFPDDDEEVFDPAWSPDGGRIAFTPTRSELSANDVWVMDADGAHRRRIARFAQQPAWSPDGSLIAFVNGPVWSCDPDGCYDDGLSALGVVRAAGGKKRFLTPPLERLGQSFGPSDRWTFTEGASFFGISWSPDGRRLVFSRRLEERAPDLFAVSPSGSRPVRLTSSAAWESEPVLSPDGTRVAFSRFRRGAGFPDLYVMGLRRRRFHRVMASAREPAWSPDGRRLAFVGEVLRGNRVTGTVFTADAEGGDRKLVGAGGSPTWSPDGRRLAYVHVSKVGHSDRYEIAVASPRGTDTRQVLVLRRRAAYELAWSPGGDRLVFVDTSRAGPGSRYGTWLAAVNADGTDLRRLTGSPLPDWSPRWSPDGRSIAFERRSRDYSHVAVFVMRADGNGIRRLSRSWKWNDLGPDWSPEGSRIVYASGRDGDYEITTIRRDGRGRRRLTNNLAEDIQPSW